MNFKTSILLTSALALAVSPAISIDNHAYAEKPRQEARQNDKQPANAETHGQDQQNELEVYDTASMLGTAVYDKDGKQIASITDLIINPSDASVAYAILTGTESWVPFTGKSVAIPYETIGSMELDKEQVFHVSVQEFKDAPSFDTEDWDSIDRENWWTATKSFFGYEDDKRPLGTYILASEAGNWSVMNSANEPIGSVDRLFVEKQSGQVALYAIDLDDEKFEGTYLLPASSIERIVKRGLSFKGDSQKLATATQCDSDTSRLDEEALEKAYEAFDAEVPEFEPIRKDQVSTKD